MRKILTFLLLIISTACIAKPTTPAQAPTNSPIPSTTITLTSVPTIVPTETPLPHNTVDAYTMEKKLLMGYQGWFSCPGDGSRVNGYLHWLKNNTPVAANLRVDMWPDTSELTPEERCQTNMKYPDGQPAYLYSAYNPKTVMRHFKWMSQYGIDGVYLQRFGTELADPVHFDVRNVVTNNVRAGAEAYGRVFAMMYDTSGMDSRTFVGILEKDWKYMVDVLEVTESPSYLHHNGKPVLAIWGLGFTGHPGTPDQAMELVNFLENNPDPKYQVTLMGGVPTWWRLLSGDSLSDPGWADYYCALDIISPWTVGRYTNIIEADLYKRTMMQDMTAASQCGVEYMPVVHPGTGFHNDSGLPFNLVPRRGGEFYWRQVYNAVSIGVPMIYNAMFDEVDEDTAMYKIAATINDQPVGVDLVSMDADGYKLPNDWYLQLGGAATQMLRGEIPLSADIPIESGVMAPPTPTGTFRVRIQITTSSDWAVLDLKSGGTLINLELVSASLEAINLGASGNHFSIGQPIERANSGNDVELIVDAYLSVLQSSSPLQFSIESGAIGWTTVKLFNYLQDSPVEVSKTVLSETSKTFEVPAEVFLSP